MRTYGVNQEVLIIEGNQSYRKLSNKERKKSERQTCATNSELPSYIKKNMMQCMKTTFVIRGNSTYLLAGWEREMDQGH